MDRLSAKQSLSDKRFLLNKELSNDWYNCAHDLDTATRVLFNAGSNPALVRPILLNAGLALELMFKACLMRQKIFDKKKHYGHKLVSLSRAANISYTPEQFDTLEVLSDAVQWEGKYPIPRTVEAFRKNGDKWDQLQARYKPTGVMEPDKEKWPTFKNYSKLWKIASDKYWAIKTTDFRELRNGFDS